MSLPARQSSELRCSRSHLSLFEGEGFNFKIKHAFAASREGFSRNVLPCVGWPLLINQPPKQAGTRSCCDSIGGRPICSFTLEFHPLLWRTYFPTPNSQTPAKFLQETPQGPRTAALALVPGCTWLATHTPKFWDRNSSFPLHHREMAKRTRSSSEG